MLIFTFPLYLCAYAYCPALFIIAANGSRDGPAEIQCPSPAQATATPCVRSTLHCPCGPHFPTDAQSAHRRAHQSFSWTGTEASTFFFILFFLMESINNCFLRVYQFTIQWRSKVENFIYLFTFFFLRNEVIYIVQILKELKFCHFHASRRVFYKITNFNMYLKLTVVETSNEVNRPLFYEWLQHFCSHRSSLISHRSSLISHGSSLVSHSALVILIHNFFKPFHSSHCSVSYPSLRHQGFSGDFCV